MTVQSTKSLWAATYDVARYPTLEGSRTADVVVIGAGITGLSTALRLAEAGKSVVVLEARTVGSGTTLGTTAHLTEAVDARYANIERDFDGDAARLVASSSRAAIEQIARTIARHYIDCDFQRVPGYLYTERREELGSLYDEYAAATRAGLHVERNVAVPLPFKVAGGIRFENQAQLHIGAYLDGIARAAARLGVRVFEQSRVLAVDEDEDCVVHLENGATVTARAVVFATHAPLNRLLLQTKLAHYRSYAMSFPTGDTLDGLFWDTDDPYHYVRSATIDGKTYLIVGGEDHKTGTDEHTHEHFERLREHAGARFEVTEATHRWSAQVIEPVDGLPLIGRNAMSKNLYVATGFAGNGLTFATVAAIVIADLVLGRANPWASLYDATRIKPLASAATFLSENTDFPVHLLGDRFVQPARSVGEVERGAGKIVRVKGERLAVYRDPDGCLHAVSAVCTHLGCLVTFNEVERTWDCPCHGSRFATDGSVVDGPATRSLSARVVDDEEPRREGGPRPLPKRSLRRASH